MKRMTITLAIAIVAVAGILGGCAASNGGLQSSGGGAIQSTATASTQTSSSGGQPAASDAQSASSGTQTSASADKQGSSTQAQPSDTTEHARTLTMEVNGARFTATLEENDAARAFSGMLPASYTMEELNGNEKYIYLDQEFPTAASIPDMVHAGDIMLFGNNCLVVFYEDFSTSYSYTKIASIRDAAGLGEAVGSGSAQIAFSLS
jgi:hypothetical protein